MKSLSSRSSHWKIGVEDIRSGDEIGRGSYGIVRSAEWRHTAVAMKILYTDAQKEDRELFEREVEIMATLHHPNIVQFFGYTRCPELALVIELFPEGSLESFVVLQKPGPKQNLSFCVDASLAIEYLHSRKPSIVIHRDIKPQNFLLTPSHRVKLGDFGIARAKRSAENGVPLSGSSCSLQEFERQDERRPPSPVTVQSFEDAYTSNCGTARYMAPEIAKTDGSKTSLYSTKADIFSLALVFYFIWERIAPSIPHHRTPILHLEALMRGKRPPFHRTPKLMRDVIESMWQLDPNDRPDAASVLDYLNRLRCKSLFGTFGLVIDNHKAISKTNADMFPRRHTLQ